MSGNILRILRKSKGISQEEVAEYLGISQTAYSKLENNTIKLSAERIKLLAHLFKVEEKSFFTSPENIANENNSLKYDHITNLLKSQKEIFDEQKELLQETINILKLQIDKKDKEIQSFLKIISESKAN